MNPNPTHFSIPPCCCLSHGDPAPTVPQDQMLRQLKQVIGVNVGVNQFKAMDVGLTGS